MEKYGWRIIERKLTDEEKAQGIIYKSQVNHGTDIGSIYTVNKNEENWKLKLKSLKKNADLKRIAKQFNYTIVEIIWK